MCNAYILCVFATQDVLNGKELAEDRRLEKLRRDLGPVFMSALNHAETIEILLNADGTLWQEKLGGHMQPIGRMSSARAEAVMRTIASCLHTVITWDYDWDFPWSFTIDGQPDPGIGHRPILNWQVISPNYFRTLEIPLLQGRDFNQQDRLESRPVMIIDDAMAKHYFPRQNPIGKVITIDSKAPEFGPRRWTIIGVVPRVRSKSPVADDNQFQAYFPYNQWDFGAEVLVMRYQGDPNVQIAAVRGAVQSVDPDVPVPNIRTFDELIAQKLVMRKLASLLVSLFSGAALCF
jgi:hypothetical protein